MKTVKVPMIVMKECKSVIRYTAVKDDAPIATVYVDKEALGNPYPKGIIVEVKDAAEGAGE